MNIDFSSPLVWIVLVLAVFTVLHLAVTSALAIGFVALIIKKGKTDAHEWAAALSKFLTGWGFSQNVTRPLDKIAAGDVAGALGAQASLMVYVANPENSASEFAHVLPKLWNDPTVGPPVQKVVEDLQSGASTQQLQSDLVPVIKQGRASLPKAPVVTRVEDLISHLPDLAKNPKLLAMAQFLQANGQADAIPALVSGHSVADAAEVIKAAAPLVAVAAPLVAAAVPPLAPAALAVGAAGVSLSASGLMDGHSINVTAAPGSPAAAATTAPVVNAVTAA